MASEWVLVSTVTASKPIKIPYRPEMNAEDVCLSVCKMLDIGPVGRHLFAFRLQACKSFLAPSHVLAEPPGKLDLRIRYKVPSMKKLKRMDLKAYNYYFNQARNDVLENRVLDINYDKSRKELFGLGVTDMYREMLENNVPQDIVETNYKKYIPKEVLKKHLFFVKKPIHDTLRELKKVNRDPWFVKDEYLKQFNLMAPEYLSEEFHVAMHLDNNIFNVLLVVSPFHPVLPGIQFSYDNKRETLKHLCKISDLCFISKRKDDTIEISRKNGIPVYLHFHSMLSMMSFISLVDGYYRLMVKWTFNLCGEMATPSLERLFASKCHGPVGGEFSYAKLENRQGRYGSYILRESDVEYDAYYVDIVGKNRSKPTTYKIERRSDDDFVLNGESYSSLPQLLSAFKEPAGDIYFKECLPPSEYDESQLLLCREELLQNDALAEMSDLSGILPTAPLCINTKDLQVYEARMMYVLPAWKRPTGGLHFSLKLWDPSTVDGIVLAVLPQKESPQLQLVIGADDNQNVSLYLRWPRRGRVLLKWLAVAGVIGCGRWTRLWLRLGRGRLALGDEGSSYPFFSWQGELGAEEAFEPHYVSYKSMNGSAIGVNFRCEEQHVGVTATSEFTELFPVELWGSGRPGVIRLNVRGSGSLLLPLISFPERFGSKPSSGYYGVVVEFALQLVSFVQFDGNETRSLTHGWFSGQPFSRRRWSELLVEVTGESAVRVRLNGSLVLLHRSLAPLVFRWFGVGVEGGRVTWCANGPPVDVDRRVNGGWSAWSAGECSAVCGGGTAIRRRTCTSPEPSLLGADCEGHAYSLAACNEHECGELSEAFVFKEGDGFSLKLDADLLDEIVVTSPKSKMRWSVNGLYLGSDWDDSGEINVFNASSDDAGVYACILQRPNSKLLVVRVVAVSVQHSLMVRTGQPLRLQARSVSLQGIFSGLRQSWILDGAEYVAYPITSLDVAQELVLDPTNDSLAGTWACVVEQPQLRLRWTTNLIQVTVLPKLGLMAFLLNNEMTRPIFSHFGSETNIFICLTFAAAFLLVLAFNYGCLKTKWRRYKK